MKLTSIASVTLQSSCHMGREVGKGNLQTAVVTPGKFCMESLGLMGQGHLQAGKLRVKLKCCAGQCFMGSLGPDSRGTGNAEDLN